MINTIFDIWSDMFSGFTNVVNYIFNEQYIEFAGFTYNFVPAMWLFGTGMLVYIGYAILKWGLDIL